MTAVERAARALIRRRASMGDALGPGLSGAALDSYVNKHWHWWVDDARAIIADLREPSGDMLHAGGSACQEYCDFTMEAALSAWRCMIDAALAEDEGAAK